MKIFQIINGVCYYDATYVHPDLCSTEGRYPPDVLFVEAPDYVFEGWGYVDGEFIKPTPPEGWLYDDETGTFYQKGKSPFRPVTVDSLEEENNLLKAQVQALSDRNEFMEDCIAEMAMKVYE